MAHGYLALQPYPLLRGLVEDYRPPLPGVESCAGGVQVPEQVSVDIAREPKPACIAAAIVRFRL